MNECKDCRYYDSSDSYKGTGYCTLNFSYVDEWDICEDWSED